MHDPFAMAIDQITKQVKDIRFTDKKPRNKKNNICRNCLRKGHWASECYAKTRLQPHVSTSSGQTGYQVNTFKRTYKGKGRGNKNYKGKGKKKWIRGADIEEEQEEEDSSDEEQEMNTNIRYLENMRGMIAEMSNDTKKEMLLALQQDFQ